MREYTQTPTAVNTTAKNTQKTTEKAVENGEKRPNAALARVAAEIAARQEYLTARLSRGADYYFHIHHRALASGLSSHAKCVLFVLMGFANYDDMAGAFPANKTLCAILGVGRNIVERAIKELTDGGWIDSEHTFSNNAKTGRISCKATREIHIPQSVLDAFPVTVQAGPSKSPHPHRRGPVDLTGEGLPITRDRSGSIGHMPPETAPTPANVVSFLDAIAARNAGRAL